MYRHTWSPLGTTYSWSRYLNNSGMLSIIWLSSSQSRPIIVPKSLFIERAYLYHSWSLWSARWEASEMGVSMSSEEWLCGSPQGEGLVILLLSSCCSKSSAKSSVRCNMSHGKICWLKKKVLARHYGWRVELVEHHQVQYWRIILHPTFKNHIFEEYLNNMENAHYTIFSEQN